MYKSQHRGIRNTKNQVNIIPPEIIIPTVVASSEAELDDIPDGTKDDYNYVQRYKYLNEY